MSVFTVSLTFYWIIACMKRSLLFLFTLLTAFVFAQTTDANGKKQGYWKKKDDTGKHLLYEGEFKDNKPVGRFKYYYPNDSVRAIMNFKEEGKIAYARLFHLTGKRMGEGKYVQEVKDSVWTYYDESGALLSKDNYTMGKKHGTCYIYLPDGKLAEEQNYKMDVQHGSFKQFVDGKKLRSQTNYVDGQLDGKATYYYPNGTEVAAGFYKNGVKTGPWIYKEENGKIKEKEWYVNGKLASPKETEEFFAKNKATAGLDADKKSGASTGKSLYNLQKEKKGK